MNYKNIIFSMFFILSLGCVPSIPAMETKGSQVLQSHVLLFNACQLGKLDLVKQLIEKVGIKVDIETFEKDTLLHITSSFGKFNIIKYLIEKDANVNAQNNQKFTPLHIACQNGHFNIVKYLIEKGANVNAKADRKFTPLHSACQKGHFQVVKYLIEKGANINNETDEKATSLHLACQNGYFEVVEHLIDKSADINAETGQKNTPLHMACQNGHLKIVKYLIEKDANVNAETDKKPTLLHIACQKGHLEIVKYLIEKGANIHAEASVEININEIDMKWTPLHMACGQGHLTIIKYLIEKGAYVHAETDMKYTLLHIAAMKGGVDIVQYLLKIAPDLINVQMIDGFTALDFAYELKKTTVVKLFAQHGVHTVSEKQAEENMKTFFSELDKEASQAQSKSAQKKQKKLQNQQRRALQDQNINTNVVKQNNSGVNKQVSKAIEMSPAVIKPTINDSVNNNAQSIIQVDKPIILADKQIEANAIAITSPEPDTIIACEPAIIVSTANAIHNFSSKADTICSLDSCVNNSSVPDNKVIITPKKQQNSIQKPNNKPVQPNQPRQINNGYQVGHDAKLKWPRSLAGAKYDLMRDHLRQLKHWPETTGLDIKQLKGQVGMFRLRVGGYRVLFMVNDAQRRILIHEIGLRKKVYRGL